MVRLVEDITKQEVDKLISSKLSSFKDSSDFKKMVRDITADAIEDLYKTLFYRSSSWKSGVRK